MLIETAPAKLNLALHVRARRPDGYHELETLFAFVQDGDEVRYAPADDRALTITGPFASGLSVNADNLVTRAAESFARAFDVTQGWALTLDKRLPVASGIGGGSADAAATLRLFARQHGIPLDDPRLFAVAAALGSDVPACLLGKTAIGQGRGEQLREIPGAPGTPVLLVNPMVAVSTADVFRGWSGVDRGALPTGTALQIARAGRNDLEEPARRIAPAIDTVLDFLAAQPGAMLARMSGSGATCFALFHSAEHRHLAMRAMPQHWWGIATTLAG